MRRRSTAARRRARSARRRPTPTRRRTRPVRRGTTLVLASLLTVVVLACGGWLLDPAGSRQPTGSSAAPPRPTTSGQELYSSLTRQMLAEGTTTYTFSGSSGGGATQSGSGSLRFLPSDQPARTFDADVTLTSEATGRMHAVLLPDVSYLALPPAKGLPRSKPWVRVSREPRTGLGRELDPVADQLRAAFDPAQSLGLLLAAGPIREIGRSSVEGLPATEHRGRVDLRAAARRETDPMLRAQYRAMLGAGVRSLQLEVWVDARGLPLRVWAGAPAAGVYSVTGVYRRWGQPVRIAAPTPKQVFDADKIKG